MGSFVPSDTMRVVLVDPNGVAYDIIDSSFVGSFNPSDTAQVCLVDPNGNPYKAGTGGGGSTVFPSTPGLRLTLTSGAPVPTSDVTGTGTLYYTPYTSGAITYW